MIIINLSYFLILLVFPPRFIHQPLLWLEFDLLKANCTYSHLLYNSIFSLIKYDLFQVNNFFQVRFYFVLEEYENVYALCLFSFSSVCFYEIKIKFIQEKNKSSNLANIWLARRSITKKLLDIVRPEVKL